MSRSSSSSVTPGAQAAAMRYNALIHANVQNAFSQASGPARELIDAARSSHDDVQTARRALESEEAKQPHILTISLHHVS